MIYTHVARKGVTGVTSPLDLLTDVSREEVEAAVEATRRLERDRTASTNLGGSPGN